MSGTEGNRPVSWRLWLSVDTSLETDVFSRLDATGVRCNDLARFAWLDFGGIRYNHVMHVVTVRLSNMRRHV